jgi:putative methionine-R-sulfoxide reductase with GAF domain
MVGKAFDKIHGCRRNTDPGKGMTKIMKKRILPSAKIAFAAPRDWPIASKLLVLVLVPIGIVLVVILSLTVTGLNRLEAETSTETLQEDVGVINQQFVGQQASLQDDAAQLSSDPAVLDAVEQSDRTVLQGIMLSAAARSGFDHLQILDTAGRTLNKIQSFDPGGASTELEKLNNLGLLEIEAFRMVPTPQGWLLTIVKPIKSQSGLIGVLSAGRMLNSSALSDLNFGRANPRLVLFDSQGNISAVSGEVPENLQDAFASNLSLWAQAQLGEPVLDNAVIQGEIQRVAYAPLTVADRVVAVYGLALSTAATTALRNQVVVIDLVAGGVTAFLAVLSAVILARNTMARPIASLVAGVKQVETGKLDVVISGSESRDEIGVLTEAFNSMTVKLQQSMEDIRRRATQVTAMADISRRLSTILNEKQLVAEVVEELQHAFNYYHTHIYFYDDTKENLVMAGGTGEVGATMLARGHKIKKGRGLVGRAAETNLSVLVPDTSQDSNWLPNPLLPDTKSEIAVPIAIGGQVLGVLDVQHNLVNGLSQDDTTLLQSIANQVAIAVRNARSYELSRSQAELESLINVIGQKIQRAGTVEGVLQTAIREVGIALGASRVSASLQPNRTALEPYTVGSGNGTDPER